MNECCNSLPKTAWPDPPTSQMTLGVMEGEKQVLPQPSQRPLHSSDHVASINLYQAQLRMLFISSG